MVGGTGTVGRHVVAELAAPGHEVRALSRHAREHPVDLTTGAGLAAALDGVDVVVDASSTATSLRHVRAAVVDGTRRLLAAERDARVRHHVLVSVVGCHDVPMAYYAAKVAQEREVADGACRGPSSRRPSSTSSSPRRSGPRRAGASCPCCAPRSSRSPPPRRASRSRTPPCATRSAAPRPSQVPRCSTCATRRAPGAPRPARAPPVRVPLPGALGRALRAGGLTDPLPDVRGTTTFRDWLARSAERAAVR